jgi:REP element-mobilizing transposase RayT
MTCARKHYAPGGQPGRFHCIARCVRRAWLCGDDLYSCKNFDHRRQWVEDRISFLADLFAVSIMSYTVMSNHLHVVLELRPDAADGWTAEEVADRWIRPFPSAREGRDEQRREILLSDPEALAERRLRLMDLSWFMCCLDEHIARLANAEDDVTGRFWEGRERALRRHCRRRARAHEAGGRGPARWRAQDARALRGSIAKRSKASRRWQRRWSVSISILSAPALPRAASTRATAA